MINEEITKLIKDIDDKKQEIVNEMTIKQNPALTKLGENSFSINVSNLSNDFCLNPKFYDFERQMEAIKSIVKTRPLDKIIDDINYIISHGEFPPFMKIEIDGIIFKSSKEKVRIHPEVIKKLKELTND